VLAALLTFVFPHPRRAAIQQGLGLVGGLVVAGLGAWLLLRRLAGQADHFHLGGGHHHGHGHEHGAQHRETQGPPALVVAGEEERPGWWALVLLGMSGGVVPCWDAIALLCFPVSAERQWLALPLVLAFSAGLAAVLVGIGIGVVHARNVAGRRWGQVERFRPLVRALPLASAAVITALGLGLCYNSLHPPQ
jgi:ABC-type nickel/cobalt efflux system permease component RcnA